MAGRIDMKKTVKMWIRSWMLVGVMLLPLHAFAYNYDYTLSGYYLVNNQVNTVSGTISISDSFILLQTGSSYSYFFGITKFFINVESQNGSFNFSGDENSRPAGATNNGALVWYGPDKPFDPDLGWVPYEKQWYLYNAQDDWNNVYHVVNFYDENMNWYEPVFLDDFGKLAPYIEVGAPNFVSQLGMDQQSSLGGGKFRLESTASAPVPEPLSIVLVGAGIGALGLARKKIRSIAAA